MRIIEYFAQPGADRARWCAAIESGDWRAAKYLARILQEGRFHALYGASARLLLGVEGDGLAAFCTLAERDELALPELTPWIGFVYTSPAFRGHRLSGRMIEHACDLARAEGRKKVYLSTDHVGLYEKYGFAYLMSAPDPDGELSRVYTREL